MRIENLFPTPVAFWNFNLTEEEKAFVREQDQRSNQGNHLFNPDVRNNHCVSMMVKIVNNEECPHQAPTIEAK